MYKTNIPTNCKFAMLSRLRNFYDVIKDLTTTGMHTFLRVAKFHNNSHLYVVSEAYKLPVENMECLQIFRSKFYTIDEFARVRKLTEQNKNDLELLFSEQKLILSDRGEIYF